jgi:hypothetical protein
MLTYGTLVTVIAGFYLGCRGKVVNYNVDHVDPNTLKYYNYVVNLTTCPKMKPPYDFYLTIAEDQVKEIEDGKSTK